MAIAAMVLGVAEFFTAGLTAIPAVICGHVARRQMRQTAQRGDGLATGGLVLGYMAIIFWTVLIAASLVGVVISVTHNGGPINGVPVGGGGGGIQFPPPGP
jgi:ABC-type Fe3+ transport system permease subunit